MSNGIVFQVETDRVLKILTRDIYDSPLALLRENVQNAYDAVRMRFAAKGALSNCGASSERGPQISVRSFEVGEDRLGRA